MGRFGILGAMIQPLVSEIPIKCRGRRLKHDGGRISSMSSFDYTCYRVIFDRT